MANDRLLTLLYNSLTPYTYDANSIMSNGVGALLKMIPNTGLSLEQTFDSDVGFTYDNTKAQFATGGVESKDQRPSDAIGFNSFDTKDLHWSNGIPLIGTLIGSASVSNGKLDCTGGTVKGIYYESDISNQFTLRFIYIPNYSGAPLDHTSICIISDGTTNKNLFRIHQSLGSANIRLTAYDDSSTLIYDLESFGSMSFVSGESYEIEISKSSSHEIRFFINGDQLGPTKTKTLDRGTSANRIYLGGYSFSTNALYDNLVWFSTVKNTTNYAAPSTLPSKTLYSENSITLPAFNYSGIGAIQAITDAVMTKSGNPRVILNDYYWNGSWVASNGSYSQATTYDDFIAHASSYPFSGETSIQIDLVFPTSNTMARVEFFSLTITGQKYSVLAPWIMKTLGTYLDGIGEFTVDAVLPTGTSLAFIVYVNNVAYYNNGTAWVASNGTVAQSNTLAQLNSKIGLFDFALGKIFQLKVFLVTTDEDVTPILLSILMTYDFAVNPSYPATTKVYGFVVDLSSQPVDGAIVLFRADDFYSGANFVGKDVQATSRADGFYEKDLVVSANPITVVQKYTDVDGVLSEKEVRILVETSEEPVPINEFIINE